MTPTHASIFNAIQVVLINQCMRYANGCNSECMYYEHHKSTKNYNEYKSCTRPYSVYCSIRDMSNHNTFSRMLRDYYCNYRCYNTKKGIYNFRVSAGRFNDLCCVYLFKRIAEKYSFEYNHIS